MLCKHIKKQGLIFCRGRVTFGKPPGPIAVPFPDKNKASTLAQGFTPYYVDVISVLFTYCAREKLN